jgi:hypothetical protein
MPRGKTDKMKRRVEKNIEPVKEVQSQYQQEYSHQEL